MNGCQAEGQECGCSERESDAGDAGSPAELVERLTKDPGPDQAPSEITGKVDAAGGTAIACGGAADEAGSDRLRKESCDPDQHQPNQDSRKIGENKKRQRNRRKAQRAPKCGP